MHFADFDVHMKHIREIDESQLVLHKIPTAIILAGRVCRKSELHPISLLVVFSLRFPIIFLYTVSINRF